MTLKNTAAMFLAIALTVQQGLAEAGELDMVTTEYMNEFGRYAKEAGLKSILPNKSEIDALMVRAKELLNIAGAVEKSLPLGEVEKSENIAELNKKAKKSRQKNRR